MFYPVAKINNCIPFLNTIIYSLENTPLRVIKYAISFDTPFYNQCIILFAPYFHELATKNLSPPQNLQEFLDTAEEKFCRMGALGSDIDAVKRQIAQLASFKQEVDPHMVKVEALNRYVITIITAIVH